MLATLTSQKVNDREIQRDMYENKTTWVKMFISRAWKGTMVEVALPFSLFDFVFLSVRNVSYLTTVCFAINLLLSILKEQFKQTTKMNEKKYCSTASILNYTRLQLRKHRKSNGTRNERNITESSKIRLNCPKSDAIDRN